VTFHGFVADPTPLLTQADAFVLASSQEGFSLATIEAMQAGVPVVATRSGGPEEILRHGETGLLVPVNDAAALADAIGLVLHDPALAERLTAAAREDAVRRFSLDAMVSAYEQLYRQLLPPAVPANG
jgi:glycosyltransferase involved in cell wall biosynthesis